MKLEINLNDRIRVRLTDLGYEIWSAERATVKAMTERLNKKTDEPISVEELKSKASLTGHEFYLWEFISIFGASIGLGRKPVIEDGEILIK